MKSDVRFDNELYRQRLILPSFVDHASEIREQLCISACPVESSMIIKSAFLSI
jgi:hypothetical protein